MDFSSNYLDCDRTFIKCEIAFVMRCSERRYTVGSVGGLERRGFNFKLQLFKLPVSCCPTLKELRLLQHLTGLCKIQCVLRVGRFGFPELGTSSFGAGGRINSPRGGLFCCVQARTTPLFWPFSCRFFLDFTQLLDRCFTQ